MLVRFFVCHLRTHDPIFDQRSTPGEDDSGATRRIGSARLRFPRKALYDHASYRMGRSPSQGLGKGPHLCGTLFYGSVTLHHISPVITYRRVYSLIEIQSQIEQLEPLITTRAHNCVRSLRWRQIMA